MSFGNFTYPDFLNLTFPVESFQAAFPNPVPVIPTSSRNGAFLPEIVTGGPLNEKCKVCSLPAHGMHFGVMSCRPCAAFFRRFVVLKLKYSCLMKNNQCSVEGRGRNVCRDCRYKKCLEVGMTSDNVQYNRESLLHKPVKAKKPEEVARAAPAPEDDEIQVINDPVVAVAEPSSSTGTTNTVPNQDVFERVHVHVERMASDERREDEQQMDEVIEDIKNLFIEMRYENVPKIIQQCSNNELQVLTNALLYYRRNQKPAHEITYVPRIGLRYDTIEYYKQKSHKFSKYISSLDFFANLPEEDKLTVVKISFSYFDRLERSQMTAKLLGSSSYLERKFVLTSYCGINIRTVVFLPQTSVATQTAEEYILAYMYRHSNDVLDNVVKPLVELSLNDFETTFLLFQVIAFDSAKAPSTIIKLFDDLRERLTKNIHEYYETETKIENYITRIAKMMQIVASMKRIQQERAATAELVQLFRIYTTSEKRNDFNCQ